MLAPHPIFRPFAAALITIWPLIANALELPAIFGDGMVLQRNQPVIVWGRAAPLEKIAIHLAGHSATTTADAEGRWRARLPEPPPNTPLELVVAGTTERIIVRNAVAGEVWLCSGQSNMEWPLRATADPARLLTAELGAQVRLFLVAKRRLAQPATDLGGQWLAATPETAARFSAIAFHFALDLHQTLGVPVGVIDASFGGTGIAAWMPPREESATSSEAFAREEAAYRDSWYAWQRRTHRSDPHPPSAGAPAPTWAMLDPPFAEDHWVASPPPDAHPGAGILRYRHILTLDSTPRGAARLSLGVIDDFDTVWVNGVFVGQTTPTQWQYWDAERHYRIPPGILRKGRNLIAIRVHDHGGGGGLLGPVASMSLTTQTQKILLPPDQWRFSLEQPLRPLDPPPEPAPGMGRPTVPGVNFHAMIAPLLPYALAGVVWYQGEADVGQAATYMDSLRALVQSWRSAWQRPELPFLIVELPNYGPPATAPAPGSDWAALRAAQRAATEQLRATALVSTIDLGEAAEIHPRHKAPLALRLSTAALALVYKHPAGALPPEPIAAHRRPDGTIAVEFAPVGQSLVSARPGDIPGFSFQGAADSDWSPAAARLDPPATIVLSAPNLTSARSIRYAWAGNPVTDLRTATGHAVGPFSLSLEQNFPPPTSQP